MDRVRQLEYFVAVAEELHFGRAAERLHVVQQSVSEQIQALERALGGRLFERTSRRVRLTALGEAFLPEARRATEQVAHAYARGRKLGRACIAQPDFSASPDGPIDDSPEPPKARPDPAQAGAW